MEHINEVMAKIRKTVKLDHCFIHLFFFVSNSKKQDVVGGEMSHEYETNSFLYVCDANVFTQTSFWFSIRCVLFRS